MINWISFLIVLVVTLSALVIIWLAKDRSYKSSLSVANAYDNWTNDQLLERLWGEHVHLGYYVNSFKKTDFRQAKVDFVHELIKWSGLDKLPKGSRVLDVGCGIGGSSRILAKEYNFNVLGITISPAQVERAKLLTQEDISANFEVMDALDLQLENDSFDAVWSVEAGPHMPDKQQYADEMLRVLRPGGVLAVADWNVRDVMEGRKTLIENFIMQQLLNQWTHPEFASITSFRKNLIESSFSSGDIQVEDWTKFTIQSWLDSILEGFRRPNAIIRSGPFAVFKGFREIPTILLMRWAFANGLMQFGVFRRKL